MPELKTLFAQHLPSRKASAFTKAPADRSAGPADFVIEGYIDPSSLRPATDFGEASRHTATSPLEKPRHSEGSFGDRTGYSTLPEPYPVLRRSAIPGIFERMKLLERITVEAGRVRTFSI